MPITYCIDSVLGLVRTTASGVLTDEELLEHKRALMRDRTFKPGMKELSDVRTVERLEVTPEGVRRLVAVDEAHASRLGDYKLAIVTDGDIVFGMARMYQSLTRENLQNVGVFREIEDAKAWLGLPSIEG
ncbi:MAG: hypothetical protein ACE5JL_16395 [Dehalococcoidia bacterium]